MFTAAYSKNCVPISENPKNSKINRTDDFNSFFDIFYRAENMCFWSYVSLLYKQRNRYALSTLLLNSRAKHNTHVNSKYLSAFVGRYNRNIDVSRTNLNILIDSFACVCLFV